MLIDVRFCTIMDHFQDTLDSYDETVRITIKKFTELLKKIEKKTRTYDIAVELIDRFNTITYNTTILIKQVIISLYSLYISKDNASVCNFIKNLNNLLIFLVREEVIENLNNIDLLMSKVSNNNRIHIQKLDKINKVIFRIVNVTLVITGIFIPELLTTIPISNEFETIIDKMIRKELEITEELIPNNIAKVINCLMEIQLKADILSDIKIEVIYECLLDKQAEILLERIESSQNRYIDILTIMNNLKTEILFYRNKKKSCKSILCCFD